MSVSKRPVDHVAPTGEAVGRRPSNGADSKGSHTPGPWKAIKGFGPLDDPDTDPERWCVVAAANDREYLIATIENGQPGDCLETEGRTAHLIAAGPELKDGCNALIGLIQLVCLRDDMPPGIKKALLCSHRMDEALAALAKAEGEQP